LDRRIDGLIIIPADERASLGIIEEAAENVPVVQLDSMVEGFRCDFVGIDNRDGIKKLICHLLSLGRTDLAFIGGRRAASPGAERLRAFIELAPEAKPDGAQRVLVGDGQLEWGKGAADALIEWGSASARTLVRSGMIPEAVVCANDLIAIGVLRGLASEGIAVPGDVLVTGFDDIRYATICSPQLTSIRQPVDELSKRAVEILEARIRSREGGPRIERVQAELVVRGSTRADLPLRDTVGELLAE
jgi:LacI family transcriptional regulator